MTELQPVSALILIVDDDSMTRLMLGQALESEGHRIIEASNGEQALALYSENHPELVLLDAILPTIDGFEVCNQLQKLPGGTRTPVLMITGLNDEESVDHAFEAGAVDYVTKPIHWAVLRQRVRRLLLSRQTEKMRDDLTQMIVHDMKAPLNTIRGYAELTLDDVSEPWLVDRLSRMYHLSDNLLNMAMMLLDISRMEEGKLNLVRSERSITEVLQELGHSFEWLIHDRELVLEIDTSSPDVKATLDWSLIQRVLGNLVSNAIKHSPPHATIQTSYSSAEDKLYIYVTDQGEGIAPEDQSRIFEKFTQARHRIRGSRNDTGLGLTFCKLATEAHGGTIQLESEVGVGSRFTLILPLKV